MSNYHQSSFTEEEEDEEEKAEKRHKGEGGDSHRYNVRPQQKNVPQEKICFDETQPFTTSSPVNMNWRNMTYTILPEEYSIIEDNDTSNQWNPDEAFSESMQLDESNQTLSSSASSSSSSSSSHSISYLLAKARQMIANYPNEEEVDDMVAENYLNYVAEVLQQQSPPTPQPLQLQSPSSGQTTADVTDTSASNDDSVILLESVGVQTSFSYEEEEEEEETEMIQQ